MKILLTCKLSDTDAGYFIEPILTSKLISSLTLFRNSYPILSTNKLDTKLIGKFQKKKFPQLARFFDMLMYSRVDLYVGIYEIPHGLFALIVSKLKHKPSVICIIGNPKYSFRNQGIRGLITRLIYKFSDIITVTGTESKNYLLRKYKLSENKVFVLPNSIPVKAFPGNLQQKKYDLITLGRLSPEKGLENLLDIINNIKKSYPDIKCGIAGNGPLFKVLKEKIRILELEQNVDLLGFVDDANEFLNSGKLFITTSFTEGLPRTAIQSMSNGIPVVASNVGDLCDLVINQKTGFLIEDANDKDAFSKAIFSLLKDEDLLKSYSENCINHVLEKYDHSSATNVWENVFTCLNINK